MIQEIQDLEAVNNALEDASTYEEAQGLRSQHQEELAALARMRVHEYFWNRENLLEGSIHTYEDDGKLELHCMTTIDDQPLLCGWAAGKPYTGNKYEEETVLQATGLQSFAALLDAASGKTMYPGRGIGKALFDERQEAAAEQGYDLVRFEAWDAGSGRWLDTLRDWGCEDAPDFEDGVTPAYLQKPTPRTIA